MKKVILAFFSVLFLVACGDHKSAAEVEATNDANHLHKEVSPILLLNNDRKWEADSATNNNVSAMVGIIQKSDIKSTQALDNYKSLAKELQKTLDKMIKECSMKGPDHDALHAWLEPLMKSVADLKKSPDPVTGKRITHDINDRLKLYSQYFE